jgi:hypothetical protein
MAVSPLAHRKRLFNRSTLKGKGLIYFLFRKEASEMVKGGLRSAQVISTKPTWAF